MDLKKSETEDNFEKTAENMFTHLLEIFTDEEQNAVLDRLREKLIVYRQNRLQDLKHQAEELNHALKFLLPQDGD